MYNLKRNTSDINKSLFLDQSERAKRGHVDLAIFISKKKKRKEKR